MDGRAILLGLVSLAFAAILWLVAKLKILAGIWSCMRPLISIIARIVKDRPSASTPSVTINARDKAKVQNIYSERDTIIDRSRKGPTPSEVKRWLQLFGRNWPRGRSRTQRASARRSKRVKPAKSQERDDSESLKPNTSPSSEGEEYPHLPLEKQEIPDASDPHQHILNEEGGADADETMTSQLPVPVELRVAYEDDYDVSRVDDADERDVYLEAVEMSTLKTPPSEHIIEPNWSPIDRVEEPDKAEADEATSFSGSGIQPDQEASVPDMDVSPAEVSQPKLEDAEGNEASYPRNSSDHEPVPEDELAAILRSYPLVAIGEALRSRRIEVTISQPDINYDRGWVSQLEQGSFSLTPATLPKQKARLWRYLQVVGWTPEALLSHLAATQ